MDVVFKGFFQYMAKMGALGAIAIGIGSSVIVIYNGPLKPNFGLLDFFRNDGQIRET
jgi:hypothetical protein